LFQNAEKDLQGNLDWAYLERKYSFLQCFSVSGRLVNLKKRRRSKVAVRMFFSRLGESTGRPLEVISLDGSWEVSKRSGGISRYRIFGKLAFPKLKTVLISK